MIRISLAIFAVLCTIGFISYYMMRNATNLLRPTADMNAWRWEQNSSDVSGGVKPDQDGIRIDVIKTDGMDWHLQLYQDVATLKDGHKYRLSFSAKSSVPRTITAVAMKSYYPGSDTSTLGLRADFILDNQWKQKETTFYAKGVDGRYNRVPILYFGAGPPGTVWMKDIRLEQVE